MHGLYLLWWVQEKGMSPALVAAILAAGDVALMALELPTGWFADRFGHRASLMLGSFVQIVGMLWCWLGEGVPGLITASVLVALGDAFRSGADEALLYRTCLALGRADDYQKIEAKTDSIALAALVVMVLVGGAIVHYGGFAIGWLAETLLCVIGLGCALAMVEPPPQGADTPANVSSRGASSIPFRQLALAILPAALLGGAASAAAFLAQTADGVTVVGATLLVATFTAAEALGSAVATRVSPGTRVHQHRFVIVEIGAILALSVLAVPSSLIVAALALAFLAGIAQPIRSATIQRLATDNVRARAASAASAFDMAVTMMALPLAGLWRTRRRRTG
jgi:Major Facilitator Superfamily